MFDSSANNRQAAPTEAGGKLFLTLFGLVLLGAGLLTGWLFVRDSSEMGLVFFSTVLVVIGGWVIYSARRPKPAGRAAAQSIAGRALAGVRQRPALICSSLILLAGSGCFFGFFLRPMLKVQSAKAWPAVPCVVLSSELKSYGSGDETNITYRVNIEYSYEFKGRKIEASTYAFMEGSSSGYAGKQAVVARYPPGAKVNCYVNPDEPTEAVLERGFTPGMWFGLIPLAFVLFGAYGLVKYRHSNPL